MARPEKKTVDYFPHMTNHGKTLFILQRKFGNDGYAFWFKLLEALGKAEYHFLDFNDTLTWEYFVADAMVDEDEATIILDVIASLEAIDRECWKTKVVYCENFCSGIMDAYTRRVNHKPSLERVSAYINSAHGVKMKALTLKGKETKLKETKGEYGQLDNVRLTEKEFDKLETDLTMSILDDYIERLSLYIPNKSGKPYVDHNAVIRSWHNKDLKEGKISAAPKKGESKGEY